MKSGDLVFYSAKLYDKDARVHAHQMVHVEIFVGGETGKESIGARRKGGVVQLFDDFRFESKRFYNTIYHFRSLDTVDFKYKYSRFSNKSNVHGSMEFVNHDVQITSGFYFSP